MLGIGGKNRLSGTPAEAGVRAGLFWVGSKIFRGLSGTPAEAGVREDAKAISSDMFQVSVEPPPKQGCELSCLKRC